MPKYFIDRSEKNVIMLIIQHTSSHLKLTRNVILNVVD